MALLQDTNYKLQTCSERGARYGPFRHNHHVPRTNAAYTRVRPYDEITRIASRNHNPQATGYRSHSAVSSFQPSEPLARASQSRPVQPTSLVEVLASNSDEQSTTMTM